jgi:ribose 5-phosphate isomerase A
MTSATGANAQPPLGEASVIDAQKRLAARAGAELIEDGMHAGLGTGSTVAFLLQALGERAASLTRARFVATSPATARIATELGLTVLELDELGELELAIDGADQVDPAGWLIKGGGGAHTREKIVAASARRFVVIVSENKELPRLTPPVPLEILAYGAQSTLRRIGEATLRDAPPSPDSNPLASYTGAVEDPAALAARLSAIPGVVEHGLFEPGMVSEIIIGRDHGVTRRPGGKPAV